MTAVDVCMWAVFAFASGVYVGAKIGDYFIRAYRAQCDRWIDLCSECNKTAEDALATCDEMAADLARLRARLGDE